MIPIRKWWPLIIIGGGPAAALQIKRLRSSGISTSDILVIADNWGAPGIEFLGPCRMQSYVTELDLDETLASAAVPGFLQPTGAEYHRYTQQVLYRSGATRCDGHVVDVERTAEHFIVKVCTAANVSTYETPCLVLATGTRPKRPPAAWRSFGIRTYDNVYRDIHTDFTKPYVNQNVYVVGSGNSALQTAALLASVAARTTVLACRYIGMYPAETDDRFAWRAASQLTLELVVKSACHDVHCDGSGRCVRFLVYDTLDIATDQLLVSCRFDSNLHQMGRHSVPNLHPHVLARPHAGGWMEESRLDHCVVVWATGSEPVYPGGRLIDSASKDENGYLCSGPQGETGIAGLFVTGSCAGRRAVNEMTPAELEVELLNL
jgi:hypothetical protein